MDIRKQSAFTLVELIVVIAVLAVLAAISFSAVSNISSSARNSARLTDVSTIASKLEMQLSFGKPLPKPENGVDLIASGSIVGYQGNFGTASARTLDLSEIKDPKDSSYYTYTTDSKLGSYQVLGFKENTTSLAPTQTVYADSKTPFTKGDLLGILIDTTNQTPIEKTYPNSSVDVVTTSSGLTAIFSDSKQLSGTGFAFGGSMWSLLAKQANFDAPKTCPAGFIPAPGNAEFLQPGFCIAKYEMKQATGDQGRYVYNGTAWVPAGDAITPYCTNAAACNATSGAWSKGAIVSKADGYPLVWLNQYNAAEACKSMGDGYHLITNNEWMALARNIEQVSSNWSTAIVGTGYIYSGHNNNSPANALVASTDDTQGYLGTYDNSGSGANQKRTLALSSGQIIWDIAGNAWEHVNKANTLNGSNYNNGKSAFASATTKWCPWNASDTNCFELKTATDSANLAQASILPLGNYDSTNGIGMGYLYTGVANNIFLRGGDWYYGAHAGVSALSLAGGASGSDYYVGFRCAK